jgi:hypothetical protein
MTKPSPRTITVNREEPFEPGDRVLEASGELAHVPEPLNHSLGRRLVVAETGALLLKARRQVGRELLTHAVFPRLDGPNWPHRSLDVISEDARAHAGAPNIPPTIVTKCAQSARRRARSLAPFLLRR